MDFQGTYTALVTPFRNGEVDFAAFKALLERQKSAGVTGVIPCGCTGEAATLSLDERRELIRLSLETVGGSISASCPGRGRIRRASTVALDEGSRARRGPRGDDHHALLQQTLSARPHRALPSGGRGNDASSRSL